MFLPGHLFGPPAVYHRLSRVRIAHDEDDDEGDGEIIPERLKAFYKSPLAYVFGRAVCDEAHYMKNASSRTTHAIKELQVRSLAFLTSTPMINRTHDLAGLLMLAWEIKLESVPRDKGYIPELEDYVEAEKQ